MTKRQIMVRAHEIAWTLVGDYAARMSYGLRQAWFEARLIAAGGNLWEKGSMRRIYMNNLPTLYGLQLQHYNTGNISYAELDGERISNNKAREIVWALSNGKLWYDLNTGRFYSKNLSKKAVTRIMTALGVKAEEEAA
jgi:hypothetical protein